MIHSGIYYKPGSLKARLCRDGAERMIEFCERHDVPVERAGKVIVATRPDELAMLEQLRERGVTNGVPGLRRVGPEELRELEPAAAGLAALHSPSTAIVDFGHVAEAMAAEIRGGGGEVRAGSKVVQLRPDRGSGSAALAVVETAAGEFRGKHLVNCAGLYADEIARMAGLRPRARIVPFRGEYYSLKPERRSLVRGLIYPVPDPKFPFLGVHFTRTIHGEVEAGPNAVLAFAREGYSRWRVRPGEAYRSMANSGFARLALANWRTGLDEFRRSLSKDRFAAALAELVPGVTAADLAPGGSGVRAQAVAPDGKLIDDFLIERAGPTTHVLNAPSPAATASLAIGEYISRGMLDSI